MLILSVAMIQYVPNALTITRIVVTPVVLVLLLNNTLPTLAGALVLFVLASISDYWDGRLARTYKVRSRLGQFLDPFADKVLVLGTFATLAFMIPHIVPWWAVALIAIRDFAVTALRSWAESNGYSLRTTNAAKWKTAAQLTFLIGMLLLLTLTKLPGVIGVEAAWVLNSGVLFWGLVVVVVITVITGIQYALHLDRVSPAEFDA